MTNHNRLLRELRGLRGHEDRLHQSRRADPGEPAWSGRAGRLVAVTLQDGNDWADHAALYELWLCPEPAAGTAATGETTPTLEERSDAVQAAGAKDHSGQAGICSRRAAEELAAGRAGSR